MPDEKKLTWLKPKPQELYSEAEKQSMRAETVAEAARKDDLHDLTRPFMLTHDELMVPLNGIDSSVGMREMQAVLEGGFPRERVGAVYGHSPASRVATLTRALQASRVAFDARERFPKLPEEFKFIGREERTSSFVSGPPGFVFESDTERRTLQYDSTNRRWDTATTQINVKVHEFPRTPRTAHRQEYRDQAKRTNFSTGMQPIQGVAADPPPKSPPRSTENLALDADAYSHACSQDLLCNHRSGHPDDKACTKNLKMRECSPPGTFYLFCALHGSRPYSEVVEAREVYDRAAQVDKAYEDLKALAADTGKPVIARMKVKLPNFPEQEFEDTGYVASVVSRHKGHDNHGTCPVGINPPFIADVDLEIIKTKIEPISNPSPFSRLSMCGNIGPRCEYGTKNPCSKHAVEDKNDDVWPTPAWLPAGLSIQRKAFLDTETSTLKAEAAPIKVSWSPDPTKMGMVAVQSQEAVDQLAEYLAKPVKTVDFHVADYSGLEKGIADRMYNLYLANHNASYRDIEPQYKNAKEYAFAVCTGKEAPPKLTATGRVVQGQPNRQDMNGMYMHTERPGILALPWDGTRPEEPKMQEMNDGEFSGMRFSFLSRVKKRLLDELDLHCRVRSPRDRIAARDGGYFNRVVVSELGPQDNRMTHRVDANTWERTPRLVFDLPRRDPQNYGDNLRQLEDHILRYAAKALK